ncbi:zinc-binding alcohol dehydrogenase family protein [Neisseria sp. Ec49-e6-T10]|uniref:zinc-binding alcohol dehydrogenase family protein n=1 Tax=Neisseria sp. Ec49-e6-T10 TaxID=3140744 RepID=UPI003EBCF50D
MKAFAVVGQNGPIVEVDFPEKQPTGHDLLIEVKAVSVNPVDTKVRNVATGLTNNARVLGYDASGVVKAVGEQVSLFKVGDEVFYAGDITRPGTNMVNHLVDERIAGRKPKNTSFNEAAAYPLTSITAYEALFEKLNFSFTHPIQNKDKTLLIINGAGGVGSIAIQLAKLAGLTVVATASRPETIEWVKKMGADYVINHRQTFAEEFDPLPFKEVDAILCLNDTKGHWQNMADVIKPFGMICSIVECGNPMDIDVFKSKSVSFAWEFMFTRAKYQTADMIEQHHLLNNVSALIEEGKVKSTLTKTLSGFNAQNIDQAHQLVQAGNMIGKVVIGV